MHLTERYNDPNLEAFANEYQTDRFGQPLFRNGHMLPMGVSLVNETTVFREYGPVAGTTVQSVLRRLAGHQRQLALAPHDRRRRAPLLSGWPPMACSPSGSRAFKSWGRNPDFMYFGGNSEMRGYQYLEFIGQKAFFGTPSCGSRLSKPC